MKIFPKLCALFRKEKLDAEMAEEMRAHLELQVAENIARGMSADDARHAAQRRFGGVEQIKERARDRRGWIWFEQVLQDTRFAARTLRKSPGFTLVTVLTLALGIGATTTMFSIVDGVLLKPLAAEQPGQLVQVFETPVPGKRNSVSPGAFLDWRESNTVFEGLSLREDAGMNLTGEGEPVRVSGLQVSANGLQLLRARPLLGRIFAPDEDQPGKDKVVVLTNGFWQRRYGGDPNVVGRALLLNDERYAVIGVLAPGFLPAESAEFVVPLAVAAKDAEQRVFNYLHVIGRLRPGATVAQANVALNAVVSRLKARYPSAKKEWGVMAVSLQEQITGEIKPTLWIMAGAVGLVLLVACANVANLLLAKASSRQKEITLRAALGATRGRIVRQLLVESVLLSLLGAVLGLALACLSVRALPYLATNLPRASEVGVDWRVLGFALVVSLLAGVAFGLAPALAGFRTNLNDGFKEGARSTGSATGRRVRDGLIVAEVALSLVLLAGTGLLLNSFFRLTHVPLGLNPKNVITLQVSLPNKQYPTPEVRADLERVMERVRALPGVEASGVAWTLPLAGYSPDTTFSIEGRPGQATALFGTDFNFCTADYFSAVGIPLRRGRFFDARDKVGAPGAVIVNETLARQYFPNEDPLGKRIHLEVNPGKADQGWEIVGVVGDVRQRGQGETLQPCVYRPFAFNFQRGTGYLFIRTSGAPQSLAESARQAVFAVDPHQPVTSVRTLEDVLAHLLAPRRLILGLLGGFAAAAMLLAAIGLYGVIAYAVMQRTREFGVRLALGASRGSVVTLVLKRGLALVAIGVGVGLLGALGLTRALTSMLYEIKPADPLTFASVSVMLLGTAVVASWLPARRAARVDPMVALRCE